MSEHKACCPHLIPWPDGKACRVCYDAKEAEVERLRAALAKCVLKRRGDAPDFPEGYRGANVPDEDFTQYVERADAVARAALRGESK